MRDGMRLSGRELRCVRGGRTVFEGVGFEIRRGDALAVTGPNGAGKSSLLRLVAGLLPAAGGAVALNGGEAELTLPEQAHYLGHRDPLKPALTVAENLQFWRDFLGGSGEVATALAATGLGHTADLPARFLSAGQRRRLSIARLLVVSRPVWLLDEPATALNTAGQAMMTDVMRDHLGGGGLILAATHAPLGIDARELKLGQSQ